MAVPAQDFTGGVTGRIFSVGVGQPTPEILASSCGGGGGVMYSHTRSYARLGDRPEAWLFGFGFILLWARVKHLIEGLVSRAGALL